MKDFSDKLPLVSVIIASYNSGKFIAETLRTVLRQSYRKIEIIVVNDGSTDNTEEIVLRIAALDSRIKYYHIKHSGRPSVPRNYAVKKASGSLFAFLDADDLWTKHKIKSQVDYLLNNSGISFVYSMCFTFGDVNFFSEYYELLPLPFRAVEDKEGLRTTGNTIPLSSVMVRREAFYEVNGFDEDPDFKAVEDYDLWLRLSEKFEFHFIPRIQVYYRIHISQSSADWNTREKRMKLLAEKRNIDLPEYKNIRRKGWFLLLLRNTIHLKFYLLYKLIGYIENRDGI